MVTGGEIPTQEENIGFHNLQDGHVQLSDEEIERLGRQRPAAFSSMYAEIGFVWSLISSMIISEFFISGFNIILPNVATALSIPEESRTWPSGVFSLVAGSFLLPFARLGDIYGGYIVFNISLVWFLIWSLIAGFSQNYMMLIFCRALQGFGPAGFLPTGIMMLGSTYRPGPRKNLVFGIYGACTVLGFFIGIFIGGVSAQFLTWNWYFWLGSIILFMTSLISFFSLPRTKKHELSKDITMDWLGVFTIVPGLVLVVFAFTDGGHAPRGWATPYIYVTFIVGVLFLGLAVYVQGWVSAQPLLPAEIFKPKHIKLLLFTLFMSYGVFGIYLFYASFYIEDVMGASALKTAAWFIPTAVGGIIIATVGGFTLHLLPGRILLIISACGNLLSTLLFAFIKPDSNYWAFVFPAMVGTTIGVDITYNVSNIFITTNLPAHQQGQAGALINSILFLGISFFLGLADLAVANNKDLGTGGSYKVAFWFGVGLSVATLIGYTFIPMGTAKSEMTVEERSKMRELRKGRPCDGRATA